MRSDEKVTVMCRNCRQWLVVLPPSQKPEKGEIAVAGRIMGFCYCDGCLAVSRAPARTGPMNDSNPWQENAVRKLEGD